MKYIVAVYRPGVDQRWKSGPASPANNEKGKNREAEEGGTGQGGSVLGHGEGGSGAL